MDYLSHYRLAGEAELLCFSLSSMAADIGFSSLMSLWPMSCARLVGGNPGRPGWPARLRRPAAEDGGKPGMPGTPAKPGGKPAGGAPGRPGGAPGKAAGPPPA